LADRPVGYHPGMQQSFADGRSLAQVAAEAARCRDCDLYRNATQTVFGEGPEDADVVLMGEQPGDKEDRTGHPFVGPAGGVLDRALVEAGIDRGRVYVTNAVKHFKWRPAGKVRLHQKPNRAEVTACRQWWELELAAISPRVLVSRSHRGASRLRTVVPGHERTRSVRHAPDRRPGGRHGAPVVDPAGRRAP
jgi:uracil-DNA glycosylase family protein